MAKKKNAPMTAAEVQPTWVALHAQERKLKNSIRVSRILQPVGVVLFALNLLLTTGNFILYAGGALAQRYFTAVPILPALVEKLPRGSWTELLLFSLIFVFVVPLCVCGATFCVMFLLNSKKAPLSLPRLPEGEAEQAQALVRQAELVYNLRRKLTTWPVYLQTGILTGLMALPILVACIGFAAGEEPAILELTLGCLVLLVCLFVLFWVYAALFRLFSLLLSLFYLAPGEWTLYRQYHRLDAYWESVDAEEFARRQEAAGMTETIALPVQPEPGVEENPELHPEKYAPQIHDGEPEGFPEE